MASLSHPVIIHADWQLWLGLAAMGVGAVILLAVVLGAAGGLFVLMFRICSGSAQFARKQKRRPAHRVMVPLSYRENGSPASYLSSPVLGEKATQPMEAVRDEQGS